MSAARDKRANGAKELIERELFGREVNINKSLLDSQQAETDHALGLLEKMLEEFIRVF